MQYKFGKQLAEFIASSEKFRVLYQSSVPKGRIFILDSSFNPPHLGHLELIKRSVKNTQSHVVLLLSVNNADKPPIPASFEARLDMMNEFGTRAEYDYSICVTKSPKFVDKALEIDSVFKQSKTYLLGFDTLIRVFDVKYYHVPIEMALDSFVTSNKFVCLTRDTVLDHQLAYLQDLKNGKLNLPASWSESIELVVNTDETSTVSSSSIRQKVADNQSINGLTIQEVVDYIEEHNLYTSSN